MTLLGRLDHCPFIPERKVAVPLLQLELVGDASQVRDEGLVQQRPGVAKQPAEGEAVDDFLVRAENLGVEHRLLPGVARLEFGHLSVGVRQLVPLLQHLDRLLVHLDQPHPRVGLAVTHSVPCIVRYDELRGVGRLGNDEPDVDAVVNDSCITVHPHHPVILPFGHQAVRSQHLHPCRVALLVPRELCLIKSGVREERMGAEVPAEAILLVEVVHGLLEGVLGAGARVLARSHLQDCDL
eukprot:CAMPEP_0202886408 /NCGR_PEP_ID=MMETSP1391-20130828/42157_1 /ASSEMBLY_ACC=CAM_ASM_000867 /TAXON_ID=1034604 /ORGANISM="Chlamydomonas leiostraca, Strain SAG 11-49" /LENGTH=238 /DNA_ID=CAMNT_0049569679 /DNA_START=1301 /DNA_END=2017 /DNA_ORIENTATION=+